MKKIPALAFLAAFLAVAPPAHAVGPLGPPGPVLSPNQANSVEAGYFLYRSAWKPSADAADFGDIEFEQEHGYVQGTIYPIRDGDVFLRVGAADFRETASGGSFDAGAKPFATIGVRGAFYSIPQHRVFAGAVAQASLYASYSDHRRLALSPETEAKADIHSYFDLSLGVGAQKDFAGRLTVYGGPFFFYSQAKGHFASPGLGRDVKTQFKDRNNLGVFAGARLVVWGGLSADAEVQARGDTSYGFKLSYGF